MERDYLERLDIVYTTDGTYAYPEPQKKEEVTDKDILEAIKKLKGEI